MLSTAMLLHEIITSNYCFSWLNSNTTLCYLAIATFYPAFFSYFKNLNRWFNTPCWQHIFLLISCYHFYYQIYQGSTVKISLNTKWQKGNQYVKNTFKHLFCQEFLELKTRRHQTAARIKEQCRKSTCFYKTFLKNLWQTFLRVTLSKTFLFEKKIKLFPSLQLKMIGFFTSLRPGLNVNVETCSCLFAK